MTGPFGDGSWVANPSWDDTTLLLARLTRGDLCVFMVTAYDLPLGHICARPRDTHLGGVVTGVPLCEDHAERVRDEVVKRQHEALSRALAEEAQAQAERWRVYVIAAEVPDYGPLLKVGKSVDCQRRAKTLGGLLLKEMRGKEEALHKVLAPHRVVGEWFTPEPVAAHFRLDLPPQPWPRMKVRLA